MIFHLVEALTIPLSLGEEFLVENLRGIQWQSIDRSIDVLVSRLRNKLGETPERTRFIKTVHGVGYIFIASKDKFQMRNFNQPLIKGTMSNPFTVESRWNYGSVSKTRLKKGI